MCRVGFGVLLQSPLFATNRGKHDNYHVTVVT